MSKTLSEKVLDLSKAVKDAAFSIPPPNSHTPHIVGLTIVLDQIAREIWMLEQRPRWPNPKEYCEGTDSMYAESQQCLAYERARAGAAMARLRLAVEALERIRGTYRRTPLMAVNTVELALMDDAHEVLALIDMPEGS